MTTSASRSPQKEQGARNPFKNKTKWGKQEIYVICNLEKKRIILKEDLYFVFEYKKE